ncbi:hypothetical protein [Nonomuraea sp. NPDC049725]|uniref:GNAT family N-acetyltransferase n=1 Tax=Nonomuraea sp. NPDC049725 TaxID=3154508 RepID=UPI003420B381
MGTAHPAHRRRGHGRRIIDRVLAIAPELHARKHPGKPLHLQLHVPDDNAAFRDHWGCTPHTAESWNRLITGTGVFRPAGSFLAVAGGHAVGCLLTHHRRAPTGALVSHALTAFRAQGYATAGLGVDADNGTGAVSVYERAGFATFRTRTSYVHVRE